MQSTLKDVADFCYAHQKRRHHNGDLAYRSQQEWNLLVIGAAKKNKLFLVENKDGKLIGACILTERPATKTLWIDEIVCVSNGFATFINEAVRRFPDYKISGLRNKTTRTYTKDNLWVVVHQIQANQAPKCSVL